MFKLLFALLFIAIANGKVASQDVEDNSHKDYGYSKFFIELLYSLLILFILSFFFFNLN